MTPPIFESTNAILTLSPYCCFLSFWRPFICHVCYTCTRVYRSLSNAGGSNFIVRIVSVSGPGLRADDAFTKSFVDSEGNVNNQWSWSWSWYITEPDRLLAYERFRGWFGFIGGAVKGPRCSWWCQSQPVWFDSIPMMFSGKTNSEALLCGIWWWLFCCHFFFWWYLVLLWCNEIYLYQFGQL